MRAHRTGSTTDQDRSIARERRDQQQERREAALPQVVHVRGRQRATVLDEQVRGLEIAMQSAGDVERSDGVDQLAEHGPQPRRCATRWPPSTRSASNTLPMPP